MNENDLKLLLETDMIKGVVDVEDSISHLKSGFENYCAIKNQKIVIQGHLEELRELWEI